MERQLQSVEEEVRGEEERNSELLQANSHFEEQIKELEHLYSVCSLLSLAVHRVTKWLLKEVLFSCLFEFRIYCLACLPRSSV